MGQSRALVAMNDPEFFKTLEIHRPDPPLLNQPPRRMVAVDADLRRWSFEKADRNCSDFPGCDFSGCNMRGADLYAGYFASARFIGADLSEAWLVKGEFDHADFTVAKLHQVRAVRASFDEALLASAEFADADVASAWFFGADLCGARFLRCDLQHTVFDRAKVRGIDLSGSTGIEQISGTDIAIGTDKVPEILTGDTAREWLRQAAGTPPG